VVIKIYLESVFNSASNAHKKTCGCESGFRDIRPGRRVVSVKKSKFWGFWPFSKIIVRILWLLRYIYKEFLILRRMHTKKRGVVKMVFEIFDPEAGCFGKKVICLGVFGHFQRSL
jgi:hypothetical protein